MAAPKRNRTKEYHAETIEKIRTSQLVNALIDHALGTNGRENMKSTQVTAALGLVKKVLPDLQSTELKGDEDNPLNVNVTEIALVAPEDAD